MKQFLILSALLAVALALPVKQTRQESGSDVSIISQYNNNNGLGPYHFSYQTADGSFREETAEPSDPNDPESSLVIKGTYGYIGTDGVTYAFEYFADKNGYHANRKQ